MDKKIFSHKASVVVIADVHLRSLEDSRGRLLMQTLQQLLLCELESLVFMGDIFDFCSGHMGYYQKKYAPFFECLNLFTQKGIKIIFIQGNHEFYMDSMPWKDIYFVCKKETVLTLRSGVRIALMHGDLLCSSWSYRMYYRLVHSFFVRSIVRFFPGKFIDQICYYFASASKSLQKNKKISIDTITCHMRPWVLSLGCDYGIVGHFHTPFQVLLEEKKGYLLGLHGWEKPNILLLSDQGVARHYLE